MAVSILLLATGLVLQAGDGTIHSATSWAPFASEGGGFEVSMPGTPVVQTLTLPTEIGDLDSTLCMLDRGDVVFVISYQDYPESAFAQGTARLLDRARDGMIATSEGKLTRGREITLKDHPGREFTYEMPWIDGAPGMGRARIYLVGHRLYKLAVAGAKARVGEKATDQFLGSFKLKK